MNFTAVFVGDENGTIICWQLAVQRFIVDSIRKNSISCIQISPYIESDFAIGYNDGSIVIATINVESANISEKQLLRGHDRQITCLKWCPVIGNPFKSSSDNGI